MSDDRDDIPYPPEGIAMTRRTVVSMLAAGAGASAVMGVLPLVPSSMAVSQAATVSGGTHRAVVSIHMDLPYIDATGTAKPYVPPSAGARYARYAALAPEEEAMWFYHC